MLSGPPIQICSVFPLPHPSHPPWSNPWRLQCWGCDTWCSHSGADDDPSFWAVITCRWASEYRYRTESHYHLQGQSFFTDKGTRILHITNHSPSNMVSQSRRLKLLGWNKQSYIPSWGSCQQQAPYRALPGVACSSLGLQHTQRGCVKFIGWQGSHTAQH
jgi:hypothetical protein